MQSRTKNEQTGSKVHCAFAPDKDKESVQNLRLHQGHADLSHTVPFETVEEAWFWFVQAQKAREDGARFVSGQGQVPRPCEPLDIFRVLDRLYRQRRILMDHILVLRHYGRRMLRPDRHRSREMRAHKLWSEALERIEEVLLRKGIVREARWIHPFMEAVE